jgi:hypothetical protein
VIQCCISICSGSSVIKLKGVRIKKISLYAGTVLELIVLYSVITFCCFSTLYVCNKEKICQIGQSAGKKSFLTSLSSETTRETKPISIHSPSHKKLHQFSKEQVGFYLAGLIDGDGHIYRKGMTISFHLKDISLAYQIKSVVGYGSVYKYTSYARYSLTNREGLYYLSRLIHNKLLIPHKIASYNLLIKNYGFDLKEAKLEKINFRDNYYLSGLFDADGNFTIVIRKRERYPRLEIRLLARIDLKNNSNIISMIKDQFGGYVGTRLYPTGSISNPYSSTSFKNFYEFVKYFDSYHLQSKKSLEFFYMRKCYLLVQSKLHLTEEGAKKIGCYKTRITVLKK